MGILGAKPQDQEGEAYVNKPSQGSKSEFPVKKSNFVNHPDPRRSTRINPGKSAHTRANPVTPTETLVPFRPKSSDLPGSIAVIRDNGPPPDGDSIINRLPRPRTTK
jgi:hypothetical protein